jgi:zinc protease
MTMTPITTGTFGRRLRVYLLALLFVPLSGFAPAAQSAVTPAAARQASGSALVTEFDVKGLKVLFKRRAGSQTVAAGLFVRGGARTLTADTAGVESLMLQVATEATANFPRERLRRELATTGTSIGAGVTYDYSAMSLASTRRGFDRAWTVFTDAVLHPSFAVEDVERVRSRILAGLGESESAPDSLIARLQAQVAYAGHPYQHSPSGTLASMRRITIDELKRCHQQMLQTSRLLLVVVGDLEPAALQAKVDAAFGALPRGGYQAAPPPALAFPASTIRVTARNLPTTFVQGVFAAPSRLSPDYVPLRVATSLLQGRVFDEVRAKRSLSYSPDAFLDDRASNVGGISYSSVDPTRTVQIMLGEIAKLQTLEISPASIRAVAQQFLTQQYLKDESSAAQAGVLAQAELLGGGWQTSSAVMSEVRAVTPADVRRVASTYMRNIQFVVVGDPNLIETSAFTRQR